MDIDVGFFIDLIVNTMAKWAIEEQQSVLYTGLIFHIQIKIIFHGIVTQNSTH